MAGAFDPPERGIHQLETFLVGWWSDPEKPREILHQACRSRSDSTVCTAKGSEAAWFDSRSAFLVKEKFVGG